MVAAVTPTGSGATLYPGGPASAVQLTIANPNPFAVTVAALSWGTPVSNNTSSCPSSNISLDTNAPTTASISIPTNTPAGTAYVIPGVLDLSHNATTDPGRVPAQLGGDAELGVAVGGDRADDGPQGDAEHDGHGQRPES